MFDSVKTILGNTLILGIIAIGIAVIYTCTIYFKKTRKKYLHNKDNEILWNWFNTFIGTFVSFLLGFAVLNYTGCPRMQNFLKFSHKNRVNRLRLCGSVI